MPVSEARKKAKKKWNSENMKTLTTIVRTETAEQFKEYAEQHGTTVSRILSDYIKELLSSENSED